MQAVPGISRRAALACAAVALATGCTAAPDKSGRFSIALGKAVQSSPAELIDLARIDAPAWDELFVLGPGSTRDENCKALQLGWLECRTTMPTVVAPAEDFLVFRVKGRIARAERHALANGDFASGSAPLPQPIPRSAAKFRVAPVQGAAAGDKASPRLEYQG